MKSGFRLLKIQFCFSEFKSDQQNFDLRFESRRQNNHLLAGKRWARTARGVQLGEGEGPGLVEVLVGLLRGPHWPRGPKGGRKGVRNPIWLDPTPPFPWLLAWKLSPDNCGGSRTPDNFQAIRCCSIGAPPNPYFSF